MNAAFPKNNRQASPDISAIREDYVERYKFAAATCATLPHPVRIFDIGCGTGYGCRVMLDSFTHCSVVGIDMEPQGLEFGKQKFWKPGITYVCADVSKSLDCITDHKLKGLHARAVAFELIEHVKDAPKLLRDLRAIGIQTIIGSVPNEDVVPFDQTKHVWHVRHYTPSQIYRQLQANKWRVSFLGGQTGKKGKEAKVTQQTDGARTLVFIAHAEI